MVNIPEHWRKSNALLRTFLASDGYLVLVVVLVGMASFGLGRISALEESRQPVRIERGEVRQTAQAAFSAEVGREPPAGARGQFVGSINSDKYHYPWCSGAQRIAEENEIWFNSKAEAAAAGYQPAGNCKGLE